MADIRTQLGKALYEAAGDIAKRLGKTADEVLADPTLRKEAQDAVRGKTRLSPDQPSTTRTIDVTPEDKPMGLAGRVARNTTDDSLPDVDIPTGPLKKVAAGAAGIGALALGTGATGFWGPNSKLEGNEAEASVPDAEKPAASTEDTGASGGVETGPDPLETRISGIESQLKSLPSVSFKKLEEATGALKQLADRGVSVDYAPIDQAIQEAKSEKRESVRRADMMELAQLVGQSLARAGAAYAGLKKGVYGVPGEIPGVDYEKRREGARVDFRDSLQEQMARRRELGESAKEQAAREERAAREQIDTEKFSIQRQLEERRQSLSDIISERRELTRQKIDAAKDEKSKQSLERENAKWEVGLLDKDITGLDKQARATEAYLNLISTGKKKDDAAALRILDEAGISQTTQLEAQKYVDEKSGMWVSGDDEKKYTKEYLEQNYLNPIRERLDSLKKQKEAAAARVTGGAPAPVSATVAPKSPGGKFIVHKSGQKKPFDQTTWDRIQSSDEASDFKVE